MRLIDADALKAWIDCGHLRPPTEVCFSELDVVRMLDKQPVIDAVQIVRCEDCKYRGIAIDCPMCHTEYIVDEDGYCDDYDVDNTTDDGFCDRGEPFKMEDVQ